LDATLGTTLERIDPSGALRRRRDGPWREKSLVRALEKMSAETSDLR